MDEILYFPSFRRAAFLVGITCRYQTYQFIPPRQAQYVSGLIMIKPAHNDCSQTKGVGCVALIINFIDNRSNILVMKKDTKQKLIQAGIEAMQEKSYHSVGIKEILDSVGVPKGSFYYYFKSKEDFGIAVIDEFARQHAATIRFFLEDRSKTPLERLKDSFVSCLSFYPEKECGSGCLVAKLSHEVMNHSPDMSAAIRNAFDMWQALYARMIREAQNAGEIDPGVDPEELAAFIQNSWEGAVMMMQVHKNYGPVKNNIKFIFDRLLNRLSWN